MRKSLDMDSSNLNKTLDKPHQAAEWKGKLEAFNPPATSTNSIPFTPNQSPASRRFDCLMSEIHALSSTLRPQATHRLAHAV